MNYTVDEKRRVSKVLAFVVETHANQKRPMDFLLKPADAGALLINLDCPVEVVIAAIAADVPKDTDLSFDDLRLVLGNEPLKILSQFGSIKTSANWCARQCFKLENIANLGLEACVVLASRTLASLRFSEQRLRNICNGSVTETEQEFFAQFGARPDQIQAYFSLLHHLLVARVDPDDHSALMVVLGSLVEDITVEMDNVWPGSPLMVETAAKMLGFDLSRPALETQSC